MKETPLGLQYYITRYPRPARSAVEILERTLSHWDTETGVSDLALL